jgi:hypothetical protein
MIVALMIFGIPSMIIASKKGFAEGRWLLTFGIIGLILVCCLPNARKKGLSHDESRRRRRNANGIGKVICIINAIAIVIYAMVRVAWESAGGYRPPY